MTPRGSGSPAPRSGGQVVGRGPTSLGYETAEAVGFEVVPERVRRCLLSSAVIGIESLSASSDSPTVMRRSNGTFYQGAQAWWGDERRLFVFGYEREMEQVGEKQFRPAGMWSVDGILSRLRPVGGPERSVWRFDSSDAGEAPRKGVKTDDPLDLLPPDLVLPIRDGDADAWQVYGKGWAREIVVAMHITKSGVLQLRAVREATSRRALSTSEWHVETLDAPVAEHAPVQFACP